MNDEIWQDIEGFEGLYLISTLGNVWSEKTKQYLKPYSVGKGYMAVSLYKDNQRYIRKVHRLVAEAFIPNPEHKPQVNHLNENKKDNRVENLEWATAKENCNYGTHNERSAKNRRKQIMCIETGKIYSSLGEASKETGACISCLSQVCNGKSKTTLKCHWKYI